MVKLRKRYYNGMQIVDVLNRHIDKPETVMNCLNNFSNLEVDDAVEVVRCKDCKWWDNHDGGERCINTVGLSWAKPENFCNYGEQKDEVEE